MNPIILVDENLRGMHIAHLLLEAAMFQMPFSRKGPSLVIGTCRLHRARVRVSWSCLE